MNVANQSTSEQTLEATVARFVLDALRACGGDVNACNVPVGDRNHVAPASSVETNEHLIDEHKIEHQVVSLKVLENESLRSKVIRIRAGAVITPAAKDYLRHKGISIVRGIEVGVQRSATANVNHSVAPAAKTLLIDGEKPLRAEGIARQLSLRGLAVEITKLPEMVSSPGNRQSIGIVVSELPVIEQDLLSRVHGRRAAIADSVESVRRVAGKFVPECWILDASRLSLSGLVSVADACIRSGGLPIGAARK